MPGVGDLLPPPPPPHAESASIRPANPAYVFIRTIENPRRAVRARDYTEVGFGLPELHSQCWMRGRHHHPQLDSTLCTATHDVNANPADWIAASPFHQLTREALPMLIVCSSQRRDSCPQGQAFADKGKALGVPMQVPPEDLSHGEINKELGKVSAYTNAVDGFVAMVLK